MLSKIPNIAIMENAKIKISIILKKRFFVLIHGINTIPNKIDSDQKTTILDNSLLTQYEIVLQIPHIDRQIIMLISMDNFFIFLVNISHSIINPNANMLDALTVPI
jgi:hypothetical protein